MSYDQLERAYVANAKLHHKYIELKIAVRIMAEALEYYSKSFTAGGDEELGTRIEFGCGCCAGTIGVDGCIDYDREVLGQTAREALNHEFVKKVLEK